MRKIILALGYIFVGLILVLAAASVVLHIRGRDLDRESKAYVDAAVTAIVRDWDIDEIRTRAIPEFFDYEDADELERYLDDLRELGSLVVYREAEGKADIALSYRHGAVVSADYRASAEFEAGSVDLRLKLVKRDGAWQIEDLFMNPQAYSERPDVL